MSNNSITSLRPLRALPALTELDVSYNALSTLDGIQLVPTLQSLRADHNNISSVRIQQTYSHVSKKLDKGGEKTADKGGGAKATGGGGGATPASKPKKGSASTVSSKASLGSNQKKVLIAW